MNIIILIAGSLLGLGGWLFQKLDSKSAEATTQIELVRSDINLFRLQVANEYSKKADMERLEYKMFEKLDRIEEKQDSLFREVAKKVDRNS